MPYPHSENGNYIQSQRSTHVSRQVIREHSGKFNLEGWLIVLYDMEVNEGKGEFWKPFLLWLLTFAMVYLVAGIAVRTLIDFGIVTVGTGADPLRTAIAAGNISVVLCLFSAAGIKGITKPMLYAGLIVATLCSLNPLGGLIMALIAIFVAYGLRWGVSKLKMAFGYYSQTNPYPDEPGQ